MPHDPDPHPHWEVAPVSLVEGQRRRRAIKRVLRAGRGTKEGRAAIAVMQAAIRSSRSSHECWEAIRRAERMLQGAIVSNLEIIDAT